MIEFHPLIQIDLRSALDYYDSINDVLGNDFWTKFEFACQKALRNPRHSHLDPTGWRRQNLDRFPYHFLFYEIEAGSGIRVMALRHNRQHPKRGIK